MKKNFLQILKIITLGIIFTTSIGFLVAATYYGPSKPAIVDNKVSAPINATNSPQAKGASILENNPPLLDIYGTLSTLSLGVLGNTTIKGEAKIKLSQLKEQENENRGRVKICRDESSGNIIVCPILITKTLTINKSGVGSGSVISNPQGINCAGAPCSSQAYDYGVGKSVALVATANSGSFTGWTGGVCSGASTTCTFIMPNTNVVVNAIFGAASVPIVEIGSFQNTTQNGTIASGTVTNDGGSAVIQRGVDWAVSPNNPSGVNLTTDGGVGLGAFLSSVVRLTPGTTYKVRTYAKNSVGNGYSAPISLTTSPGLPTLTTTAVSGITQTTATSGGSIISNGGTSITGKGVVWSIYQNPTIYDTKTSNGSDNTNFASSLSGLASVTTYYVRAYATNSVGTGYGNQLSFTTLDIPCGGKVVAGYCWYLNLTQNQNCNTYCASRGGCKTSTLNFAQVTEVCQTLGMGGIAGGTAGTNMPNTDGSCYVRGTVNNTGSLFYDTCSQSQMWRKNACSCNQ